MLLKTDRLLGLLSVLANKEKITIQELAVRFKVSKRTVSRDLDTLSRAGIPIVTYPGIGGGVSIMEGYKLDKNVLSLEDTEKLFTALNGLKSIDGDPAVTNLLAKLIPGQEAAVFSQSHYAIDFSSWFNDSVIQEKAALLHQAINGKRCVRLEYISKTCRQIRVVEPHKLVFKQSDWYLYAFCQEREAFRLFKLRRIVSFEMLEAGFQPRPLDKIQFENHYGADLFSAQPGEDSFEVVLSYNVPDEFELTQIIDASFFQRADAPSGQPQIRFYASDLAWVGNLVMGLLGKVRVVSPPELHQEIKRRLEKINSDYKR